ncbi:hypothetical protein [Lacinutrix jangbogonensis]|uniref:hypothetical protein n=1 Tax=Lacinutrix jangbogonensis TaxID=1469557 RepID=UPI00053D157F|nr:hypothetical protein [Lacinutrix jangbogonensis]
MKTKILLIPIIALLLSINSYAQKSHKEKIDALKVAHITEQLDLTAKEAQVFWPIYNANEEARFKLRDNKVRNQLGKLCNSLSDTEITETEAKELLNQISIIEENKHKLQKEYLAKLNTVLTSKKILKLMNAERTFKRKMLKEFKERHGGERSRRK